MVLKNELQSTTFCAYSSQNLCQIYNLHLGITPPLHTVALDGTLLGSESTYMKEASKSAGIVCKIAGLDPLIDYHCNPSQILPHFYVNNKPRCYSVQPETLVL